MATLARRPSPESGPLIQGFAKEIEKNGPSGSASSGEELRSVFVGEQRMREQEREEEIRQMRERFSASQPDDAVSFQMIKRQLMEAMEQFQALVPGSNKAPIPLPRSWEEVMNVVAGVSAKWDAKEETPSGKVKGWLRKLCSGLNSHSTVLQLLPKDSEYVSIIAGAVTLIIKASSNYSRITESFAKGIIDINDAVATVQRQILAYNSNTHLQQLAMRLYTQIFAYLVKFMTWFQERSAKRLLHSFNESLYKRFQDDLDEIRKISGLISTEMITLMVADGKLTQLLSEGANENTNYLIELAESQTRVRDRADKDLFQQVLQVQQTVQETATKEEMAECFRGVMDEYYKKIRQDITAASLTAVLDRVASGQLSVSPSSPSFASSVRSHSSSPQSPYLDMTEAPTTQVYRGSDIAVHSAHLEDLFSWTHVDPFSETGVPTPLLSEATFVSRLRAFANNTVASQILYAHGPYYQNDSENILRRSSAGYASLAREASVPVVSYFVELSHEEPPANRTRETVELTALICALIRQVVDLLPAQFESSARMDQERFAELDGKLRTWDQAVEIFADLVQCVQMPIVLFVIDGLNFVEDDFLERKIEKLVNCFEDLTRIEDKVIKIMFTTAGLSGALSRRLRDGDMFACQTASPVAHGRRRNGRQLLFY